MKAIVINEHGGPEVLEATEVETPTPGPGEVQVEIKAAAMNRADLWVRDGWPGIKLHYPHILGADAAGVISALGEHTQSYGLEVGQRVVIDSMTSDGTCEFCQAGQDNMCIRGGIMGEHYPGTYAQYAVVAARNVLPLPDNVDFDKAAAASLVYLTAWHSLIEMGGFKGRRVGADNWSRWRCQRSFHSNCKVCRSESLCRRF